MKITDIITGSRPSLSFEVFPPKNWDTYDSICTATEKLAGLNPSYMSVTYGAGGGTTHYTVSIASNLQDRFDVPVIAHLTCISSSKDEVRGQLDKLRQAGIRNILALRGDMPKDAKASPPITNTPLSSLRTSVQRVSSAWAVPVILRDTPKAAHG